MIDQRTAKLSSALRTLIRALDGLSDEDVINVVRSIREQKPARPKVVEKSTSKAPLQKTDNRILDDATDSLRRADSRELGYAILTGHNFTRRELETLAKRANVHVVKNDNIDIIEEKLVESLIGSRLNSMAIQTPRSKR